MDPFDVAQSFIESCESERSPTSWLTTGFQRSVEALGFRYFACCAHVDPLHPPPQAIMIHNYPAAWVEHYSKEKLYQIDPVLQPPKPISWAECRKRRPGDTGERPAQPHNHRIVADAVRKRFEF